MLATTLKTISSTDSGACLHKMCVVLRLEWNDRSSGQDYFILMGFSSSLKKKIPLMQRNLCVSLVKCGELWADIVIISLSSERCCGVEVVYHTVCLSECWLEL